ncbi:MAG: hypothetical protein NUV47_02090 [Patescibacteria group bacterium]|nr:hypothetical protein [Patescibacteria group bacterium]
MAKFDLRLKALKRRRIGESIGHIAKELNVSKGTVSLWCSDIELTEKQKEILAKKSNLASLDGRMRGVETNRKKRLDTISRYEKDGKEFTGCLSSRDKMLIGVALYWAEGSKKKGVFSFVNSDAVIVKCVSRWLNDVMGVSKEDFIPRVAINEMHRKRIEKVLNFWSNLLELPRSQFRNTFFIKTVQKKVYENYDTYYGTLVLRVRNSTHLKYRILGLIEGLKNGIYNLLG